MNLREHTEKIESETLCEFATLSANTKGRAVQAEKCGIRTEFQRDRDKITHCKSFRRLMHKTQVFITPEGDHYRTRLTHTLEVAQISRTISRALRLNEDLTEAIALGHDLGHTPFGHTGEDALDKILEGGFRHNEQSVRVVTKLENNGAGLNLTAEVIDGILCHRSACEPQTLEGKVVQLSDKIAYINHDIDDAIRAGVLKEKDLPADSTELLGGSSSERISFLIHNTIHNSYMKNCIALEPNAFLALRKLRAYMFSTVYESQLQMHERNKIKKMLEWLFVYYKEDYNNRLSPQYLRMIDDGEQVDRVICDHIAGMTDRYASKLFKNIYVPNSWDI